MIGFQKSLLDVVSELTGYPVDMLEDGYAYRVRSRHRFHQKGRNFIKN
jgi:hypothetical protein